MEIDQPIYHQFFNISARIVSELTKEFFRHCLRHSVAFWSSGLPARKENEIEFRISMSYQYIGPCMHTLMIYFKKEYDLFANL